MAQTIRLEFTGMKEIEAKFTALSEVDRMKFFAGIFNPLGNKIVRKMRANAPISKHGSTSKKYPSRTHPAGTLRKSIGKKLGGTDIPTVWISPGKVGKHDVHYAGMVLGGHEVGSATVAPNPFVRRTWDEMLPEIDKYLSTEVEKKLKAVFK